MAMTWLPAAASATSINLKEYLEKSRARGHDKTSGEVAEWLKALQRASRASLRKDASAFIETGTERWPSGLRRSLGKRVYGKPYRGFESLPLRQLSDNLQRNQRFSSIVVSYSHLYPHQRWRCCRRVCITCRVAKIAKSDGFRPGQSGGARCVQPRPLNASVAIMPARSWRATADAELLTCCIGWSGQPVARFSGPSCLPRGSVLMVAVLFAAMLAGCAGRPGPELLTPIARRPGVGAMGIHVPGNHGSLFSRL